MVKTVYLGIIVCLMSALLASQLRLYRAAEEIGRLKGRQEVFDSQAAQPDDGTCYAKGGCK